MSRRFVCVTGCAGFLGRYVTRALLERGDFVYGVDALTYAAHPDTMQGWQALYGKRFQFVGRDVRSLERLPDVDAVIHLAAETHVDNSLTDGPRFAAVNVGGTTHMLELVKAKGQHGMPHYIHISTDEVYGTMEGELEAEIFNSLQPSSPYAASKAAADLCVMGWGKTYEIPWTILRPTNCYGEGQYPEKLIPKTIRSVVLGRPMTIHGDGTQTRCWLSADDFVRAVLLVLDRRLQGIYNIGGNTEASVKEVVERITNGTGVPPQFGFHRPAGDLRYAVNSAHLVNEGWKPTGNLWRDLPALIATERERFRQSC